MTGSVIDVLVLNQYYEPDVAVTGRHAATIARRLALDGLRVRAVVGQPSYEAGLAVAPRREFDRGVAIERVTMPRGGRERMAARVASYLVYLTAVSLRTARMRPRVILSFHNPPMLGAVACLVASRSGARLIYVPQDIHPDVVVATKFMKLPAAIVRAWDRVNVWTLERADRVVVLGEGMRQTVIAKGVSQETVRVIPLWAEPELPELEWDPRWRLAHGLPDRPLLVYADNLGAMHQFQSVLEALERIPRGALQLLVAGGGALRAHWEAAAATRPHLGIHFLPYQSGEDYRAMLAASAATLVTLTPGMERLAVPSKAWSSMAAGRPIVAHMALGADVAALVDRTGGGWVAPCVDSLEAAFRAVADDPRAVRTAGRLAREAYESEFRQDIVTERYVALTRELLGAT